VSLSTSETVKNLFIFKQFKLNFFSVNLNTSELKWELQQLEKVKAIYTMVEDEINEQVNLWGDKTFLEEIDMRLAEYENGSIKTSTFEEIKQKAKASKT